MEKIEIMLPISDRVADTIRRDIMRGVLKGGQKISVNEISGLLGVSATPVKEAFKMLQSEGLLEMKARSATRVSDFAKRNLEQTVLIRAALEGAAANIAARCADAGAVARLEAILLEADAAIERNDLSALVAFNTDFHQTMRNATRNSYLILLIDRLVSFDYSFRKSALSTLEERKRGRDEHWAVFNHIKNREPEAAEAALAKHIRRSATDVVDRLEEGKK